MMWSMSIWIMAADTSTNPNADTAFAGLIDAIITAIVTDTMPIMETDPVTGQQCQLLAIGEQFTVQQSPVHALADQRLVMYEALINLTIEEASSP
jgi:hypothetical protein